MDNSELEDSAFEEQPLLPSSSITPAIKNQELLGLSLTTLSAFLFSIMSVMVKGSANTFSSSHLVFHRSLIQLGLSLVTCKFKNVNAVGPREIRGLLIGRGLFGAISLFLYFFTLTNMNLGDGTSLFFIAPALTSVLAYLVLGEPFARVDAMAAGSCLIGVLLVSRPSFIFGSTGGSSYPLPIWIPSLAAIIGACASSVAYLFVRRIGKRVDAVVNVGYFGLISTILSGTVLVITEGPQAFLHSYTVETAISQLSIGILAFLAQFCVNRGLQLVHAGPGTVMRNLDILFAFIWGVNLFHEPVQLTSIIGASLIGGATAMVAIWKFYNPIKTII